MNTNPHPDTTDAFHINSNIHDDVWHADTQNPAYEWWYFDAVSDDGRDVLVVIFLTNFIFSPRYNQSTQIHHAPPYDTGRETHSPPRFPAVVCCLYRDGRPLIRSITEHDAHDFTASTVTPACRIGDSSFEYMNDENNPRYELNLDIKLRAQRHLKAHFAWRTVEASLLETAAHASAPNRHEWNMVAPHCHVEGSFRITDRDKHARETVWTGTGYHDHNRDTRPLTATVAEWQWGRAHFPTATAIFYRFREHNASEAVTRLLLICNRKLTIHNAQLLTHSTRLNRFGLRYPHRLSFETMPQTGEQITHPALHITQHKAIDASFFYLRFHAQATLDLGDGTPPQTAPLISEHLAPRALRWRWIDWLVNMRIGRGGRTAFLP